MKKIGQGWQYTVYDLGNGRVRKVKSPLISQYRFIKASQIRKERPSSFPVVLTEMHTVNKRAYRANAYVGKILPIAGGERFGNPTFLNDFDYEQDKVIILKEVLNVSPLSRAKQIIDQYVLLMQRMWSFGCCDMMFNFTENSGINKNGNVIANDFGELVFSHKKALRLVETKKWLRASPYKRFPEGQIKSYYRAAMNKSLTPEKLDALWGIKIS